MALLLSFLVVPPKVAPSGAGSWRRPPEEEKESGVPFLCGRSGIRPTRGSGKALFPLPAWNKKGRRGEVGGEAEALAKSGIKEESTQKNDGSGGRGNCGLESTCGGGGGGQQLG